MKRNGNLILITMALSFAGCISVPKQPVAQDPFAGLFDAAPPAYPNLTVAVFISENTKNSVRYGMESAGMLPGASELVQSMLDTRVEKFKKNFKSAVRIEKLEDASKTGADLVAVMDFLVQTKGRFKIHDGLVFMTREGRTIETLQVDMERRFSAFNPMGPIQEASSEAQEKLLAALRNSVLLAEFAKTKGSAAGAAATPSVTKIYHSDVDKPGYRFGGSPDDLALVVGIENYQNLPPADFAERDAAAVREHLLALGYPERNIIYLVGSQAGRTGIEKYIETWLPLNVKEDSRLFVYFSGHGAPDAVTGQAYLVPWDGDAKFLKNTGYPIKRLYESLNGLKAKQVVLAMDACFSGEGGRSVLAKGARPLVTKVDVGMETPGRLVVFAATAAAEITDSEESQGHGLFTYYFLKGLQEKGGKSTLRGLYDYVLPRVQDAARRNGREQTPQLMPADIGSKASVSL
jgi:hypothetical protein